MASSLNISHTSYRALYSEFLELVDRFEQVCCSSLYDVRDVLAEIEALVEIMDPDGSFHDIIEEIFTGESMASPLCIRNKTVSPEVQKAVDIFLHRLSMPMMPLAA